MDNNTKIINIKNILMILVIMISIISLGTFAWLSYRSNDTAMVLKIGEIDGMSVTLKPYQINSSLNPVTTYDSGIVIDVTANNKKSSEDNFKLFYKIDSIDSELINSSFKYTVTKSTDNGTTYTVVKEGDFSTATSNSELEIYRESVPGNNTTYLYKVYLWIDGNMGDQSSMQGKVFTGELRASVSFIKTVYTANVVDLVPEDYSNAIYIGQPIPNNVIEYNTPDEAITAFGTTYSSVNNGATANILTFLKHVVESDIVTESYVGFIITPELEAAYPGHNFGSRIYAGMKAGTYYLKGGDDGESFLDNAKTIYDAFGDNPAVACILDGDAVMGGSARNPYENPPSTDYSCYIQDSNTTYVIMSASADSYGDVDAYPSGMSCRIINSNSFCRVNK